MKALICMVAALVFVTPTQAHASEPDLKLLRDKVEGLAKDPHAIINNSHYVVSNEFRHHTLGDYVKASGGVYIGIGTDQNFMLLPWTKARYAVMVDLDQVITNVHRVYEIAFRHAKTPNEFRLFFAKGRKSRALKTIGSMVQNRRRRGILKNTYRRYRGSIHKRLTRIRKLVRREKAKTYLTDQAMYDFIANMCREGRFFAVRGNMNGSVTLQGLAAVFRGVGLRVGTLFFSNAERYFPYSAFFKANMSGFQYTTQAQVIRTSKYPDRRKYQYFLQPAADFLAWLARPEILKVRQILSSKKKTPSRLIYEVSGPPGT